MPSERNTDPTKSRISKVAVGAFEDVSRGIRELIGSSSFTIEMRQAEGFHYFLRFTVYTLPDINLSLIG
jgi:hypothetical protein